ncbi:MAG: hypothetical protein P4L71_20090 [Acetobacteraceae bacterium]|nr:hypothetical protein [Acetobacteraceae bacterium]
MREFQDIASFLRHMTGVAALLSEAGALGVKDGAEIVAKEAKAELGRYQEQVGPFVGWAELADYTKDERVKLGFSENEPGLRDGAMRDSIGVATARGGGGEHQAVAGSNDQNLEWFEGGTAKQPPRPVLGGSAYRKEALIVEAMVGPVVNTIAGLPRSNRVGVHPDLKE